ncbi:NAD(P)/FAD-dependent oxidoreductase [Spongiimicrobium sp. 2-473A-2-J]|uniref:NAD(P)/FAD-dependent oxidoreductase n=1 Tax=Eudoraea algarum TaxID=3417568 RepID=UPI003D368531
MRIVIIGAGPAGSACAISVLKAGYEVTLIDRVSFPRHAPGETLHPGVEPLLKELGVLDEVLCSNFLRHHGIENIRDGYSKYQPYNEDEDWRGFQLSRKEFDTILVNRAIKLGADFYRGVKPIKVDISNKVITSLETNVGKFEGDYFIDATGKRAWLANNLRIEFKEHSPKWIAYYGYVKNSKFKPSNPKLIWDKKGWTWISQINENLVAWVHLNLRQHEKVGKAWIPELLNDGESTGPRKAADVTWRIAEKCGYKNCFLVGDAAFVLDPGSSHGVLKAIMSGMMIAHLISRIKLTSLAKIQEHYDRWMKQQFLADKRMLNKLYNDYCADLNIA